MRARLARLDCPNPSILIEAETEEESFILNTIRKHADSKDNHRLYIQSWTHTDRRLQSILIGEVP
jgi:hypothetical protein